MQVCLTLSIITILISNNFMDQQHVLQNLFEYKFGCDPTFIPSSIYSSWCTILQYFLAWYQKLLSVDDIANKQSTGRSVITVVPAENIDHARVSFERSPERSIAQHTGALNLKTNAFIKYLGTLYSTPINWQFLKTQGQ